MKTKILSLSIFALLLFSFSSCDELLDRPPLTTIEDAKFWVSESNLRLFVNDNYTYFFPGYNTGYGLDYAPLRGYTFSDDFANTNKQSLFETSVPSSRSSNSPTAAWLSNYQGPTWDFYYIRKSNLIIERMNSDMTTVLTADQFKHWTGVAKFFKAMEYARLVATFGDVPYFDKYFSNLDKDIMFKDRTPRAEVMDSVYSNFVYAMNNVKADDGTMNVNKYVVAGFVSRWMLFEGTWQKYQMNDNARAKKYLDLAIQAGDVIAASGKYTISSDFRALFGSDNLSANKECIMYRQYSPTQAVTHAIASYSNCTEAQVVAPNLALVKSFICNDGKVWQKSTVAKADSFNIANLIKTRDPRFEATFWNEPRSQSATLLYACKFIDRDGARIGSTGINIPTKYASSTNTNGYPVMRFSEVLLNWIEAKAEVATVGGVAVTQGDIDNSINKIRNRPLDADAIAKGVKKTAAMSLASLPADPTKDVDVSDLIWEVRRERRMEFVFEHSRLLDIKRWKKIQYMNGATNPDILLGIWVDVKKEIPSLLIKAKEGKLKVKKGDGTIVTYTGTNGADMIGFYLPEGVANRDAFTDQVYLAPIGKDQIDLYTGNGYKLTQTKLW